LEQALATHAAIERAAEERPGWEDFKSEGVIDHIPDPGPDGEMAIDTASEEQSVRALEMEHRAEMIEAEHVEERVAQMPRVTIRGPDGRPKSVTEKNAETADRKFHAIRTGHLTAVCQRCSRQVVLPERVLRSGLERPRCRVCKGPLEFFAALRRA
jgi:hypothetical protein